MSTLLRQGVEQDGVGVGLGVGVGVGVTGGDGMKFVAISAPPPHAVSANAPALASRRLEKCRTLMALLPLSERSRVELARPMCDDGRLMII